MEGIVKRGNVVVVSEQDALIVRMYADNQGTEAISQALKLSPRTVETRMYKLKKKFEVNTLMALVAVFFRQKLID